MRIAVSGTHFIGKTTLIEDFIGKNPDYKSEVEPYYQLQDEVAEGALEPCLDSFLEQLDYSINQLNECQEQNIIFDRCPIDFLAYALYELDQDDVDINESEVSERLPDIKEALNNLDLIIFLPITKEDSIEYTEENPAYRKMVDKYFKKLYRDDICDVFPDYDHPKIVEIAGNRMTRLRKLESCLK
jgi:hypothetical protein